MIENKGFDPSVIHDYKARILALGNEYLLDEEEESNEEYAHFYFIGMYEGKEVIYDAAMYTLRLHHESELYEIAEDRTAKHFPNFKKISYNENKAEEADGPEDPLAEEFGLYMAEIIVELEEEDAVKVQEHVDQDINAEFGISLDIGLNVEAVTPTVITKFIQDFKGDKLSLDETFYSFQIQDNDSE